jgi:hypothetical protein
MTAPQPGTVPASGHPTVQAALRAALRDVVGPSARAHGFRGSAPGWHRTSPDDDWAAVQVQSSQGNTRRSAWCVVNVAVVPAPWRAWQAYQGLTLPARPNVAYGQGAYWGRLYPTGTPPRREVWWQVNRPEQAVGVATDIRRRLEESGWPALERLLDRDELLAHLRQQEPGPGLVVLLADRGHHAELEDALVGLRAASGTDDRRAQQVAELATWARRLATAADDRIRRG